MKSAFGIPLDANPSGSLFGANAHGQVSFWRDDEIGWCGQLTVGCSMVLSENIGSASPEACYRSLRGRAQNLAIGLAKLGIERKKSRKP